MDYTHYRDILIAHLRRQLIGPGPDRDVESDDLILKERRPSDTYPTGLLFPTLTDGSSLDASVADDEDDAGTDGDRPEVEPVKRPPFVPPSSVGFTFHVSKDAELHIFPWAVHYEHAGTNPQAWRRVPLSRKEATLEVFSSPDRPGEIRRKIWGGRAELYLSWRERDSGWLVTVSLANRQQAPENWTQDSKARIEFESRIFFETELRCVLVQGRVLSYPGKDPLLMSEEEQELELQYRHHAIHGVGHGTAVNWEQDESGRVAALYADFLPRAEIPRVTPDNPELDQTTLTLDYLASPPDSTDLLQSLEAFVDAYAHWAQQQAKELDDFSAAEQAAAQRILKRIDTAIERMRAGIALLRRDDTSLRAFQLANQAMRKQMHHRASDREPRWRPFQLGFLLLTLSSVQDESDPWRDTVDLIWFPTGGGKTEAYLAVIAFVIIHRRLAHGEAGRGTSVIMRYTLRLLTQQQFQRAVKLIFALELLRREQPERLGEEPISAGMWVGAASTPNTFDNARKVLRQAPNEPRSLIFTRCPWCDTPLWHSAEQPVEDFHCPNDDCEMNARGRAPLPLHVVDEALYAHPPSLLFATIDKFARLAWEERAHVFFGRDGQRPPELIIQDELHLVASALGSIAGIYEAALDSILQHKGVRPKLIASTATIRDADLQVRRLYARQQAVFPPPGLRVDDAFFTRTLPLDEAPGRLYLGYLPAFMNRAKAFARLAAVLLEAPVACFEQEEEPMLLDAWWTLLVYHGSLRGVGQSHNGLLYDASAWLQASPSGRRRLPLKIRQLTSTMSAQDNSHTFQRLERGVDNPDHLDAVLATNMISVGLDVGRLALMIVNGQPLTTAEYIQATSRVGRSGVPGLIIANYYRSQARSLSHLENFRPYHESFYRFVEPTSVTPFTYQARKRALHAALVSLMRHAVPQLNPNQDAQRFDPAQADIQQALQLFAHRCGQADPEQAEATKKHIEDLARAWADRANDSRQKSRRLVYSRRRTDRSVDILLHSHGDTQTGLWETLNSMRNVEETTMVYATGLFEPPCATRSRR
ncbi:helicase-related protein [Thiolapillus sp.]